MDRQRRSKGTTRPKNLFARPHPHPHPLPICRGVAGATLVEVLAGLGILLTILWIAFGGIAQEISLRLWNSARPLSREVESSLKSAIREHMRTYIGSLTAGCASGNFAGAWAGASDPVGNVSFDLLPGSNEVLPAYSALGPSYTGDAAHEAAKSRCMTQQPNAPGFQTPTADGSYFCLRLRSTLAAPPKSSIFAVDPVFAEVQVALRDANTGQPLACKDHHAKGTREILVHYALYWQRHAGSSGSNYFHLLGMFNDIEGLVP